MPSHSLHANSMLGTNGALTPGASGLSVPVSAASMMSGLGAYAGAGDAGYDFFDPQHWMLDGLLDFNYSFAVTPLEGV